MDLDRRITIEKNNKGNIVYSYFPVRYKETFTRRVIIPQMCIILTLLIAYFIAHQSTGTVLLIWGLVFFVISSFILLYRWALFTEKQNEKIEETIVDKAMKDNIKQDISSFSMETIELERKLVVDSDKHGEVNKKYLTLVLSNGIRLKYNINFISYYSKILVQEIDVNYETIN